MERSTLMVGLSPLTSSGTLNFLFSAATMLDLPALSSPRMATFFCTSFIYDHESFSYKINIDSNLVKILPFNVCIFRFQKKRSSFYRRNLLIICESHIIADVYWKLKMVKLSFFILLCIILDQFSFFFTILFLLDKFV